MTKTLMPVGESKLIDALRLEGCWDVETDGSDHGLGEGSVWWFSCGLALSNKVVRTDFWESLLRVGHMVHERHHYEGHLPVIGGIGFWLEVKDGKNVRGACCGGEPTEWVK